MTGILLQGLGLALGRLCRRDAADFGLGERLPVRLRAALPRVALGFWLCGVALLLSVAVYDRDVTLFVGQGLAAYGFRKVGWI